MYKKRILGLAIASALTLTGCLESNQPADELNTGANHSPDVTTDVPTVAEGAVYPIFNPALSTLPIPSDLNIQRDDADTGVRADGTYQVPDTRPPVTTALNDLSGASTTAAIDLEMSDFIDSNSINANGTINVVLLETTYMSGSPVQGLSIKEPPVPVGLAQYDVSVLEQTNSAGDPTHFIRITPTKPLKPNTRYVVAVTNSVTAGGDPIVKSPGLSGYGYLTDASKNHGAVSSLLTPVAELINNLWEPLVIGYAAQDPRVLVTSDTDLAMTYSFTTSGDEKVLEYIANPAEWVSDQLNSFIRVTAAKSVLGYKNDDTGEDFSPGLGDISADGSTPGTDGAVNYLDIKFAADAAINTFPSTEVATALGIFGTGAPCDGASGPAAISCTAAVLSQNPAFNFPTPEAQTVTIDNSALAAAKSIILSSFDTGNTVKVAEGNIELPYYLGIPSGSDGTTINASSWTADNTLAATVNGAFAALNLSLPQSDANISDVVNYIYPFPEETDTVNVPLLATYPHAALAAGNDADNDGVDDNPIPVVIYQHGIRLDRSAMLAFGTALSANGGYAVIGMDQPIHGIIEANSAEQSALAQSLLTLLDTNTAGAVADTEANLLALTAGQLANGIVQAQAMVDAATAETLISSVVEGGSTGNPQLDGLIVAVRGAENAVAGAGSTIPGIQTTTLSGVQERHFGFTASAALEPVEIGSGSDVGGSGSLFINLRGFTNSRDKLRQGALDLMNLTKSLENIDLDGDGDSDLDTSRVYFVGQSLGTVNGTPFITSWNSSGQTPSIRAASLQVPGGGIGKMLENSPGLSGDILNGLAASGITQGSSSFETFMATIQATLDSVDPINFADNLSSACSYDNTTTVDGLNTFETCAPATGILISEISGSPTRLPDLVIPNETYNNTLNSQVPTARSALSGTDPLIAQIGASNTLEGAGSQVVSRFSQGSHGTFVLPQVSPTEAITEALDGADISTLNAERGAVFQANLAETITLFVGGGTGAVNGGILNDETTHETLRAPR